MVTDKKKEILKFVTNNPLLSSKEIHNGLGLDISYATIKRVLAQLISDKLIITKGEGKGRKYQISPTYQLFYPLDITTYFEKEIDEREIDDHFNFSLIQDTLSNVALFNETELQHLNDLQEQFIENTSELTNTEYIKDMERLAIDLSWKSSQIEGNTYSLLETEHLLKEKESVKGKSKDEAIMLLNHKEAIDFIIDNPDYTESLTIACIEDIHSILVKNLGVERNIRKRQVGISGTNYKPLDNEHQIKEALKDMCALINTRDNVFEKALLTLILISYIQAFGDGNKRTARIISNAMLMSKSHCPLSFRTINSIEYKKAMLVFYEQNNISAFKKIFIDQFKFAVNTYF